MIITDEFIHHSMIGNGIGFIIAGLVFLTGGVLFGVFFERERRRVTDARERRLRLIAHAVTAALISVGLWLTLMLGARWIINAGSYNVYETTVADKQMTSTKKANSHKHHIRYHVRFDGISTVQTFSSAQKDKYDAIEVGDRALVVKGVGNSFLKVWYGPDDVYDGTHMVSLK